MRRFLLSLLENVFWSVIVLKRLFILVISCGFLAVDRLWAWMLSVSGKRGGGICVVLYYHGVTTQQRQRFAQQMDHLLRWAEPISTNHEGALGSEGCYVALTFDDGFLSVIENALPELIQRNIPSTIFIPTGYLGQRPQWDGIGEDFHDVVVSANHLKSLPSNLISIGSHSVTHRKLTFLHEPEAKWELSESRRTLEGILGGDVKIFSFPHGEYNEKLLEWAREAGYTRVFTILPTRAFPNSKEYFRGRVKVDPTDWHLEFRTKLLGGYCWLPHAFKLKRVLFSVLGKT